MSWAALPITPGPTFAKPCWAAAFSWPCSSRNDRTLRIRTLQAGQRNLPAETRIPLDYFAAGDGLADYAQVRALCHVNPLVNWAAYIGGSIFTLLKEEPVQLPFGFSMLLLSAVPMNVGIGSSAAVEIGALNCLNAYLGIQLDPARMARLGQIAENHVVGAPCGIMDQISVTSGRQGRLTQQARCRRRARWKFRPAPASSASTPWCAIPWRASLRRRPHRRLHGQKNH